ncbi:hypothetical protein [Streptomyces sp. NPDC037389]|uniref:hypothetical protein n=1 Tax=Streptomyces sp. NPDC037389 TaxID=3155369 RepID=UPI0034043F8C
MNEVYGLGLPPLPSDHYALRAVVVVECLTENGLALRYMYSGTTSWGALGMVEATRIRLAGALDPEAPWEGSEEKG